MAASALGGLLDHVISVEEAGVFKPHPKVYDLTVERLGLPAASIAFQSSNSWDAYAASAYGMRVVWCNRYGQRPERCPAHRTAKFDRSLNCQRCSKEPDKCRPAGNNGWNSIGVLRLC